MLAAINKFASQDVLGRSIVGIHLEGPYLSQEKGPAGAHNPEYMCDPNFEEFRQWYEVSGGRVSIITVAPERKGMCEFVEQVTKLGVKVAIGHTAALPEQMEASIKAGADMSTHLGNGAHGMLPRWDNYVFRQLADDRLWAGIIADGDHLPDSNLRIWFRSKGQQRIILVSDLSSVAGLPSGVHVVPDVGEIRIEASGRINVNDGSGNLAGAGRMLDTGVAKAVQIGEFDLAQCLEMATLNPARYMDLEKLGALEVGKEASLFLFEKDTKSILKVRQTVLAGEVVYSA